MLSLCSAIVSFVLLLAEWLPQLQATLLHSKQHNGGTDAIVFSANFFSGNEKLL